MTAATDRSTVRTRRRADHVVRTAVRAAWMPVLLIMVWWVATEQLRSPFFPPLRLVLERFADTWLGEGFVTHALPSLINLFAGLGIGVLVGICLGVLLGRAPLVEQVLAPFLHLARALPAIALLPTLLVLIGTNDFARIALIAWGAFWPVLLNTIDGVRLIPAEVNQATAIYRVSLANRLFRVILPGSFPQITIGITLAIPISLVLLIASELYGSTAGIGYTLLVAQQSLRAVDVWAGVLLLGILGYLLNRGYSTLEHRLLQWRDSRAAAVR
ncbi:ABC transporter permease [Agromyces bauzanensis]